MFSVSHLGPLDAHNLWYTSTEHPERQTTLLLESEPQATDPTNTTTAPARSRAYLLKVSRLGRLTEEELLYVKTRHAYANFGFHWLKPPGIGKTLAQIRDEQREQAEAEEQERRTRLQQELAEAEAEAAMRLEQEMAEEGEEPVDLDDEIPDADEGVEDDMGFAPIEDSDEDESEEDSNKSEESSEEKLEEADEVSSVAAHEQTTLDANLSRVTAVGSDEDEADRPPTMSTPDQTAREQRQNVLLARRMHQETIRRNLLRHGAEADSADDFYGDGSFVGGPDLDAEEDMDGVMEENDGSENEDNFERDLDDEIPEGELSAVYEHTDSDATISSNGDDMDVDEDSEEDDDDNADEGGFDRFARRHGQQAGSPSLGPRRVLHRADVSDFLAPHQESSILESSPPTRRAARQL